MKKNKHNDDKIVSQKKVLYMYLQFYTPYSFTKKHYQVSRQENPRRFINSNNSQFNKCEPLLPKKPDDDIPSWSYNE